MKMLVTTLAPSLPKVEARPLLDQVRSRAAAFVSLTKPRIALMVLITVATGFLLGARRASHPVTFFWTLLGTGLVAAGASVWNQYIERDRDARMRRTASRSLPTGRVRPTEAWLFGSILGLSGIVILAMGANAVASAVAATTFILYVLVYTPLKPVTTLNTAIGAIPGALPPVIGWTAATGQLGIEAFALFLILFLWQFPHFLAIAWIHREDYARGGHRMLPGVDPRGVLTGRQAASYALALVPAGLLPTAIGLAGGYYFAGALLLGCIYLASAIQFWTNVSDLTARKLLRTSIFYLPAVLGLLLLNPLPA